MSKSGYFSSLRFLKPYVKKNSVGFTVFLDKNMYNGMLDYEIEIESSDSVKIPDMFKGVYFEHAPNGKYKRFSKTEKKIEKAFESDAENLQFDFFRKDKTK